MGQNSQNSTGLKEASSLRLETLLSDYMLTFLINLINSLTSFPNSSVME